MRDEGAAGDGDAAMPDAWNAAAAASQPSLGDGEVHLWRISLAQPDAVVAEIHACLSDDERQRETRFRFDRHRRRFVLRTGAMRILLGRYLGIAPDAVAFRRSEHGKPEIDPACLRFRGPGADGVSSSGRAADVQSGPGSDERSGSQSRRLRFNLSDSADLALLGVVWDHDLGVDVEHIRSIEDMDDLVERFFAPGEREAYRAVPRAKRAIAFYQGWTRKEAWLKGRGDGLIGRLDSFEVSLGPDAPPELLRADGEPEEPAQWRFWSEMPAGGYLAAVAVRSDSARLVRWVFERGSERA